MLVLGSTHPVEPAGLLASVILVENAVVKKGRLIIVPRANKSGYTATEPGQGYPDRYEIKTDFGTRWFRFGMRNTNPIHQWPDPDVYTHYASGQKLAGAECGNLNRCHPGHPNGRLTDKIAYGIYQLIKQENADISIDLHEAPPCRPLVNAICAHERAMDLSAYVTVLLEEQGIKIRLEASPKNLRGLSHREWGDSTDTMALLMETTSPMHGPLHGPATVDLLLTAKDDVYVWASKLGRTVQKHTERGVPIEERVGRHVTAIMCYAQALSEMNPEKGVVIEGIPSYQEFLKNGVGHYLKPIAE
ncbi:MAG TPA: succinylglutamate desuccinylase/aspartoacylase [Firmicutes bacterium]|nr:succinylglutamate desuccinylase/aspartoacylase [Bacillota bacterium]